MADAPVPSPKPAFPLWGVALIIVLTAGLAAGSVFLLEEHARTTDTNNLQAQISSLQSRLATSPTPTASASSTATPSPTPTAAADATASWKTYTNTTYKFSFRYPSSWPITEAAENTNDARRYDINLNFDNGTMTATSYDVEVLSAGSQSATDFVNSFYGGIEGGPSRIAVVSVAGLPAVNFFMQKAGPPAGAAYYLFKEGNTAVAISNGRTGEEADIMNDATLAQIAGTFQFTP